MTAMFFFYFFASLAVLPLCHSWSPHISSRVGSCPLHQSGVPWRAGVHPRHQRVPRRTTDHKTYCQASSKYVSSLLLLPAPLQFFSPTKYDE